MEPRQREQRQGRYRAVKPPEVLDHHCPYCHRLMSIVRVNNICGTCQAWSTASEEAIKAGAAAAKKRWEI